MTRTCRHLIHHSTLPPTLAPLMPRAPTFGSDEKSTAGSRRHAYRLDFQPIFENALEPEAIATIDLASADVLGFKMIYAPSIT